MSRSNNSPDAMEVRRALDELLDVFLAAVPSGADLPVTRRARDVLCKMPPAPIAGGLPISEAQFQDSMITGSD